MSETFADLVAQRSVLICCGTGGVGKTTTAASIGLAASQAGRRAVVVTIDPAKRLADALGLDQLDNDPRIISETGGGTLAAMMLDTKATFDGVVHRFAGDDEQAERILANRFYRNVSSTLSGTQDYMAVEKLLELHESDEWDLVVVDTPPTRDALAFLEAPRLITRLIDNPIYRIVTAPSRGALKAVTSAAQKLLRRLSRVVGAQVVNDAVEFFQAFEGMEDGFRERADRTMSLLGTDDTGFVLVASSRADTLNEARYFIDRVRAADLDVEAVIVNRTLPPTTTTAAEAEKLVKELAATELAGAAQALLDLASASMGEADRIAELTSTTPDATVVGVPLLADDVHDMDGLAVIAGHLMNG